MKACIDMQLVAGHRRTTRHTLPGGQVGAGRCSRGRARSVVERLMPPPKASSSGAYRHRSCWCKTLNMRTRWEPARGRSQPSLQYPLRAAPTTRLTSSLPRRPDLRCRGRLVRRVHPEGGARRVHRRRVLPNRVRHARGLPRRQRRVRRRPLLLTRRGAREKARGLTLPGLRRSRDGQTGASA